MFPPPQGTLLIEFSYRRDVGDTLINAYVSGIDMVDKVDNSQILYPPQRHDGLLLERYSRTSRKQT